MAPLNGRQFSPYITPQRRHEVEAAMPPVYVGGGANAEARTRRTSPANPHGASGKLAVGRMLAQHALARAIMQSDVPVEHLEGIDQITLGKRASSGARATTRTYTGTLTNGRTPSAEVVAHKGHSVIEFQSRFGPGGKAPKALPQFDTPEAASALARYHATDTDPVNPRTHADRDERRRDVVHELGHHNDPLSADQFGSVGVKEAHAENYADRYQGPMKTSPRVTYDDPENQALTRGQKASYAKVRIRPAQPILPRGSTAP